MQAHAAEAVLCVIGVREHRAAPNGEQFDRGNAVAGKPGAGKEQLAMDSRAGAVEPHVGIAAGKARVAEIAPALLAAQLQGGKSA